MSMSLPSDEAAMRDEEFPAVAFDERGRILPMSEAEAAARGDALLRAIDGPKVEMVVPPIVQPSPCGPGPLEVTYLGRRLRVCTVLATPADVAVRLDEMFPAFATPSVILNGEIGGVVATTPNPVRKHWQRDTEKTISPADDPIAGEGPCPDHPHKRHYIMVAR